MQTGNYLGMFSNAEPDMIANHSVNMQAYVGTDVVPLYTSAPASMTQFYQVTQWMIPITCDNPEKTMEIPEPDLQRQRYRKPSVPWNRRNTLQLC